MPPGRAAACLASPPPAGSSQSAAWSPASRPLSALSGRSGSGRLVVNSSAPSGRNLGFPSPSADLVSLAGGPPAVSIRQMLVMYFFLSGPRDWTAAASQVPSGASRNSVTRGIAR